MCGNSKTYTLTKVGSMKSKGGQGDETNRNKKYNIPKLKWCYKSVLRWKFKVISSYIKKKEKSQPPLKNPSKLWINFTPPITKKRKINPKMSRKKGN